MKKIVVNTRLLLHNKLGGIGWFTFEVMRRITQQHPEHQFYYVFDRKYSNEFITSPNIIPIVMPPQARHPWLFYIWFEVMMPRKLKQIGADLFISTDNFNITTDQFPSIVVLHDLNFEHYPEHLPKNIAKFYRKNTPKYARTASRIVTVSEFSKRDIQHQYGISQDKIDVVFNGVNTDFLPLTESEKQLWKIQNTAGLPFFLFVGMIHPRKNLANQLKAFDLFRKDQSNPPHKFYIVGEKWFWDKELKDAYDQLSFKDDVMFVGRLCPEELSKAVASSTAMLYVSFFEGFGIPILEGFYAETAVITSNTSSMPEVAENAAICVDPHSPLDIANAMTTIARDTDRRDQLIEAGKIRRTEFSWDKTASLFWKSIEKVLADNW